MRAEVIATRDGGGMQSTVAPFAISTEAACFDAKACVARLASKSRAIDLPQNLREIAVFSSMALRDGQRREVERKDMKRQTSARVFGGTLALMLATAGATNAQTPITEQEAHAIGVDAYVYFYPLVTMDITRKQATNIEPGKVFGRGPMNMFVNVPAYPPADYRDVVRSNFDTLYSVAT